MATKPKPNPKKPLKKIKVLNIKRTQQKSLLVEYFYPLLAVLIVVLSGMLYALGYGSSEAVVIALWVGAILFAIRQVWSYVEGDAGEPAKQKKGEKPKESLTSLPKDYKPPETPRVSKDFSPMPPAGDKRYPPPSPFIKPPK